MRQKTSSCGSNAPTNDQDSEGPVGRRCVIPPSPDERRLLADTPRGAWVLMLIIGSLLLLGWLALYFGRFLGNGVVR